jgi:DMSO/TMAO reductase YedYZ molybdopterin-dependent catalytic subunit
LNGSDLAVGLGAPLRMRVPRQLGYKSIKFMNRIVVADNLKHFGKGLGSNEPEGGYSWYAGI